MAKLQKLYESKRFARLIVDEVHCVSQFGHDFRPGSHSRSPPARRGMIRILDYKYLSIFKRQFPNVSILGLTATATIKVMNDIRQILRIPHCILFRAPFNRKNLFYEVLHKSDVSKDAFSELVNCIQARFNKQSGEFTRSLVVRSHSNHSSPVGIVYCLSQKDAEDVCSELQRSGTRPFGLRQRKDLLSLVGIKAGCYHAGLSALSRTQVHENWIKNRVHVICATIAFGSLPRS